MGSGGIQYLSIFLTRTPKPRPEAGPWKPEAGTRSRRRNPEAGSWRNNMVFFIGLRELHRSIKFLVEFGVGRRLVAWAIKLPYETLPPWWGLVGVGRKLDGEAGNVCINGDAFSHTPNTCAASECMGQDPGILRGRILARLRIRGMRSFNKTRRPKLRILILDSAGPACASWACKSWGMFSMFVLVPGDNLVDSWYQSRSLGHVTPGNALPKSEGLEIHPPETRGSWMRFSINWRLYGLSSRNPEAEWTFVPKPGGWMDFRLGTRRLDGLSGPSRIFFDSKSPPSGRPSLIARLLVNISQEIAGLSYGPEDSIAGFLGSNGIVELLLETLLGPRGVLGIQRSFLEPGGCPRPGGRILEPARKTLNPEDPEVVLNPEVSLDPKVVLNPEVSFGPGGRFEPGGPGGRFQPGGPGGRFQPGGCSRPGGRFKPGDPEVVWEPEGSFRP
ncbi:hypothetical protein F2Q69_00042877 [Brassica cretica]|uniref:Uncharacterized protein n=1 Tax=Brassica cretica TaxID=69181 RepID=A0A8S9NHM8_BRACR|nr:hypothetical protein F2Q69_00042877 [Brassica cretica]